MPWSTIFVSLISTECELRPLAVAPRRVVGLDDFRLGQGVLAVLRDRHSIIGKRFLEELGIGAELGETETLREQQFQYELYSCRSPLRYAPHERQLNKPSPP